MNYLNTIRDILFILGDFHSDLIISLLIGILKKKYSLEVPNAFNLKIDYYLRLHILTMIQSKIFHRRIKYFYNVFFFFVNILKSYSNMHASARFIISTNLNNNLIMFCDK